MIRPLFCRVPSTAFHVVMGKERRITAWLLGVILLTAGCATSPWSADSSMPGHSAAGLAAQGAPGTPLAAAASGEEAPDPAALQSIMVELRQLGAIDPASQEKLLADLQQTDPALWPLVLQHFRAAVAYRRRAQEQMVARAGSHPPLPAAAVPAPESPVPGVPMPGSTPAVASYPPLLAAEQPRIGRMAPGATTTPGSPAVGAGAPGTTAVPASPSPPAATTSRAATAAPAPKIPPAAGASPTPTPMATPTSVPSAVPAPIQVASAGDWHAQVVAAAQALESSLPSSPQTPEEVAQHARLRMLQMLAGQRDQALQPIPAATAPLQQFWLKELYGLSTWLDAERNPDAQHRAAEAKQVLSEAAGRLGETAPLFVGNLAFCTAVQSYGSITPFSKSEFKPGQEVLLYAEVENFSSEQTAQGFHTSMRSSYQIFDSRGQQVAQQDFPITEEHCQRRRRDYFIGHQMRMPKRIYDGRHTLKLTIEDLNSHKIGQSSIEFWIVGADQ